MEIGEPGKHGPNFSMAVSDLPETCGVSTSKTSHAAQNDQ
jgi:hypothetical protein